MEKGVKQGKSSYLLLSMKKDQANKTNVERVYRWQPLAWEPGLNGSGIDLWLVQEWAQHSCTSCASTLQSWSRAEAEEAEWRWRLSEQSVLDLSTHIHCTCGTQAASCLFGWASLFFYTYLGFWCCSTLRRLLSCLQ